VKRGHDIKKHLLWGLLPVALLSFAEPSTHANSTEDSSVTLTIGAKPIVAPDFASNWYAATHPSSKFNLDRYYSRIIDYSPRANELRPMFAEDTSNVQKLFATYNDFEDLSPENLGEALEAYTSIEQNKAQKAHDYRTTGIGASSFDKTDANYKRIYQACLLAMRVEKRLLFTSTDAGTCRLMARDAVSLKSSPGIDSF
jgi:hypothetical protein